MTAKAFVDTNIYIYALTQSQDQNDESKRMIVLSVFETLIQSKTTALLWLSFILKQKMKFVLFLYGEQVKMNKNSTSVELDDFDEYPKITSTVLEGAVHQRNFVEVPQKTKHQFNARCRHYRLVQKKSGENEFHSSMKY